MSSASEGAIITVGMEPGDYYVHMENTPTFSHSRWMRYGVKPLAVASFFVYLTSLLTLLLQSVFPYPFLFLYFGAVMGSAWFGGGVAGAISVALSTLIIQFFFVPPFYSFSVSAAAGPYFFSYIVCAALISWATAFRRRAENLIRESRDLLEERVHERTAELERSNHELLQSERNLRELTEAIPQQLWRADAQGAIVYCNSHLLHYTGRTQEEMRGERFLEIFHLEDLPAFLEAWTVARESVMGLEGEWRIRSANGLYCWFLIRAVAQRSATDSVECWYGTHIDMEDWKRAELALAASQTQLAHVSRVMSMGEVTASVAHEINQPLTAIVAHAYACLGWLKAANLERAQTTTEKIIQEGTHAGAIVSRIRALFLKGETGRTRESINQIILDTVRLLRDESIRRHVRMRVSLDNDLPFVDVDRVQMQQAVLNLAMNGMDAMDGFPAGKTELLFESSRDEHGNILVRVTDRGHGVNPDFAARIFDAFFTTKTQGLGMGLSISRTVVEAHDGRLWVSANPAGGSIFQFSIPVPDAPTAIYGVQR